MVASCCAATGARPAATLSVWALSPTPSNPSRAGPAPTTTAAAVTGTQARRAGYCLGAGGRVREGPQSGRGGQEKACWQGGQEKACWQGGREGCATEGGAGRGAYSMLCNSQGRLDPLIALAWPAVPACQV